MKLSKNRQIRLSVSKITSYLAGGEGPFEGVEYATIGSLFHSVSYDLLEELESGGGLWRAQEKALSLLREPGKDALEQAGQPMRDFVYDDLLTRKKYNKFHRLPGAAQLALWNALENLFGEFVPVFQAGQQKGAGIETIMLGKEQQLEWIIEIDGKVVAVTGRYDLLFHDPRYETSHLLDFKLCGVRRDLASLTQVMIYALMLWENKGIKAGATVLNLYPERGAISVSWPQIAAFRKPLMALIQDVAAREFPELIAKPAAAPKPRDTLPEPTKEVQCHENVTHFATPDLIERGLMDLELVKRKLQEFGLEISRFDGPGGPVIVGPSFVLLRVSPGPGVKVVSLSNRDKDLQIALSLNTPPRIEEGPGYVQIEVPRLAPDVIDFAALDLKSLKSSSAGFAFGVDIEGVVHWGDFSKPSTCHLLAGGQTGSGKSEFLRQLLCSLAVSNSPRQLQIVIVDPKMTDYQDFDGSPYLRRTVVCQIEEAVECLRDLVDEMQARYETFKKHRVKDLDSFNCLGGVEPFPRIVVAFDEFADAMADKGLKNDLEKSLKRLGAKARAAGIHLIIATQSPRKEVITGLIKANLPCAVALRVANSVESKIVIDGSGAEKLLGRGDMLVKIGGRIMRLQSPYASQQTIREVMFP